MVTVSNTSDQVARGVADGDAVSVCCSCHGLLFSLYVLLVSWTDIAQESELKHHVLFFFPLNYFSLYALLVLPTQRHPDTD